MLGPVLLIIGVFFLLFYFVMLCYFSFSKKKERNSFLNSFPYQFYGDMSSLERYFLYGLLCIGVFLVSLGESIYFISMKSLLFVTLSVLFPLSLVFLLLSNLIPLSKYKLHIFFAMFSFAIFMFSSLLYGISEWIEGGIVFKDSVSLFSRVVILVFGVLSLLSFVNPKLLDWPKMERSEVNGTTYYVKPKVNFLALYEWAYLLLQLVSGIIFFANALIC